MTHCKRWIVTLLLGAFVLGGITAGNLGWHTAAQAHSSGYGFGPQAYKSGYSYGNGVFFAPYLFTVYPRPDDKAPPIGEFHWNQRTGSSGLDVTTPEGNKYSIRANHAFFCFYPKLDVAMMPVIGEENGWVEVIYDQSGAKSGWVRLKEERKPAPATGEHLAPMTEADPEHFGVYQTWPEFMKLNAKANGIYWLSGVKDYNRSIRSSDADEAKIYPITIIRDLKVKFVRGNWMMVEVLDFERNTPIGWVRWRDDDGNLMVFPNISGEYRPIVTTSY